MRYGGPAFHIREQTKRKIIMKQEVLTSALESYFDELAKGSEPAEEQLAASHPRWAHELRAFYSNLNSLRAFRGRMRPETPAPSGSRTSTLESESDGTESSAERGAVEIGGYRLLAKIGRGRQGIIFQAEHVGTGRTVALKVIRNGQFASRAERRRFENEALLASRLHHPNIVEVLESGQDCGLDFVAMELVDGLPLDRYCLQHAPNVQDVVRLHLQVCRAVGYAHQHGVLHRDLKPSNILVDSNGQAHILDFGLAKPLQEDEFERSAVTQVGDFAGTWHYASPEQVMRDPRLVDVRSDVYALGVLLYEMLTGCYPYPIRNMPSEIISHHILNAPPRPPSQMVNDLDTDLETIVLRSLSKEPDRRYQSAAALADDLERFLAGRPIEAKRDDLWYVFRRLARRNRGKIIAAVAACICLFGFVTALAAFALEARVANKNTADEEATSLLRLNMARDSLTYTLGLLDDLHRAEFALRGIAQAHPDLPEIRRALKEVDPTLAETMAGLVAEMPEHLLRIMNTPEDPGYLAAIEWLELQEANLAEIADLIQTHRPEIGFASWAGDEPVFLPVPANSSIALRASNAYVALALLQRGRGEYEAVLDSLDTAREIAISLGDGPDIWHKGASAEARKQLHGQVLTLLATSGNERELDSLLAWIHSDPPLPIYHLGTIPARLIKTRVIEGGSRAYAGANAPCLDLDALNLMTDGLYEQIGQLTDERRRLARSLHPNEAFELLHFYLDTMETWEDLPAARIDAEYQKVLDRFAEMPADPVVRPLLPGLADGFRFRGQCLSTRAAALLAAELCRFRLDHGYWPESLSSALPEGRRHLIEDPYLAQPFGYRFVDSSPVLYSLNKDGRDDGGLPGEWEQDGTDVVLFHAQW